MLEIIYSDAAAADIDEIAAYLAKDNPQAAISVLKAIRETANILSATPLMGAPRFCSSPDLKGLRGHPVKNFLHYHIYYIPDQLSLTIIRVIHSTRDYTRFF